MSREVDRLLNLIKNEYIKIFAKTSMKVLLILFFITFIGFNILMKVSMRDTDSTDVEINNYRERLYDELKDDDKTYEYTIDGEKLWSVNFSKYIKDNDIDDEDPRIETLGSLYHLEKNMKGKKYDPYSGSGNQYRSYLVYRYILDNDIEYYATDEDIDGMSSGYGSNDFAQAFNMSISMEVLFMIVMVAIAGTIVSSEFASGTIKFYIINPVTRGKLIISKLLAIVSLFIIGSGVIYVLSIPINMLLHGTSGMGTQVLVVKGEDITAIPMLIYSLKSYGITMLGHLIYILMAFMLSSFARNNALAIASSIMLFALGSTAVEILLAFDQDWARYIIFANTNLTGIYKGLTQFPEQTLGFALGVIAVHFFLMILTAYDAFTRREI